MSGDDSQGKNEYGRDFRDKKSDSNRSSERREGGYQGNRDDRGPRNFDRRDGGAPRSGGYQGNREGGYQGNRDDRGPRNFDRRDGGAPRSGGYQGNREGGYQGNRDGGAPRSGGYQGNRESGYQGNRDGGFQGNREGGFQGNRDDRGPRNFDRRDGGAPRSGGYQGNREGGPRNFDRGGRDDRGTRNFDRRDDRAPREGGYQGNRDDRGPRNNERNFERRDDRRDGGFNDARGERFEKRDEVQETSANELAEAVVTRAPALPDDIAFNMLDRDARGRLRTLSKENAEVVGLHLIMAGRLLDEDPELAYQHAQEALRRGGRVDIVREAAGLAAYYTDRYAEALREFRTVRRLNGSSEHLAIMADCERGLGRPERAITLAQSEEASTLGLEATVELAIVVSGARVDMGENDAALANLEAIEVPAGRRDLKVRVVGAKAAILELLGRDAEVEELLSHLSPAELASIDEPLEGNEDVTVFDLSADFDQENPDEARAIAQDDAAAKAEAEAAAEDDADEDESDQDDEDDSEEGDADEDQGDDSAEELADEPVAGSDVAAEAVADEAETTPVVTEDESN